MIEAKSVLDQFETPGAAVAFLSDLFAGLNEKFDGAELATIKTVIGSFATSQATDPGTGSDVPDPEANQELSAVGESLRRSRTAKMVKGLVDDSPFESRRPPIEPENAQTSVAALVGGFRRG